MLALALQEEEPVIHDGGLFSYHDSRCGRRMVSVKESKEARLRSVPVEELPLYPFVALNRFRYNIVAVDVDDVEPGELGYQPAFDPGTFEQMGIPLPNFSIVTSGSRFHALWVLANPVPRTVGPARDYLFAIRDKVTVALNGDLAFNLRGFCRNPFHVGHKVLRLHDNPTTLDKLNIPIRLDGRFFKAHSSEYVIGNRNRATFLFALNFYRDGMTRFEELLAHVELFQDLTGVEPLGRAENRGICASVVRNGPRYGKKGWVVRANAGIMLLPPEEWGALCREEREEKIKDRKRQGQAYVAGKRREGTRQKLAETVERMKTNGLKLSVAAIAREAGVTRNTVMKYLDVKGGEVVWKHDEKVLILDNRNSRPESEKEFETPSLRLLPPKPRGEDAKGRRNGNHEERLEMPAQAARRKFFTIAGKAEKSARRNSRGDNPNDESPRTSLRLAAPKSSALAKEESPAPRALAFGP